MGQLIVFATLCIVIGLYLLSLRKPAKKTIIELEAERLAWSIKTFTQATAVSSLEKLKDEITEVEHLITGRPNALTYNRENEVEEYVDCLMCLFDSAGRRKIYPAELFEVFEKKFEKNKARTWVKNENDTYSHVK